MGESGRAVGESESSAAGWGLKDNGLVRRLLRCGLSCLKIRTAKAAAEGEAEKEAAQQQRQRKRQRSRNSSRARSSAAAAE